MFMKKTLVAAVFLGMVPMAASAGEDVKVAIAANFVNAMTEITAAYNTATGNNVTFDSGATANLEATIIAGAGDSDYDLFLAANSAAPADLYSNHLTLVYSSGTPAVYATPFTYAQGGLELWSKTVDVSAGLPATGDMAIANPSTAPYGLAASQVLSGTYGITLPNARVTQYNDINLTYNAVNTGAQPMGWVARSQICTNGTFPTGYHHSYDSGYTAIVQNGIKLARASRSPAETAVLNDFVNYLTTNTSARATITKYCYALPN